MVRADATRSLPAVSHSFPKIVFIDEVEGIKRRITDEAGGRVCNPTLDPDTEAINDI